MAIISQETWDKFTEEEKEKIKQLIGRGPANCTKYDEDYKEGWKIGSETILEELFGKENPQLEPKIRTWEDVKKIYPDTYGNEDMVLFDFNEFAWDVNFIRKCIATLKIAKLIELGYGGMVTEEEWKDDGMMKFAVKWNYRTKDFVYYSIPSIKTFIAFHTSEQREEFMSHSENVELVKQYNMI